MHEAISRRVEAPRLLVLGGGAVTKELYGPAIEQLRWWPFVTVVEPSVKAAAALLKAYPGAKIVRADFNQLLSESSTRDRFDGLIVALPNQLHETAVDLAITAKLPVLCEKPFVLDSRTCRRLAKRGQDSGRAV